MPPLTKIDISLQSLQSFIDPLGASSAVVMDPVSALGLAAAVVQFVQFTASLFNGTRQIYQSGGSERTERLEYIHGTLSKLSNELLSPAIGPQPGNSARSNHATSLAELATRCKRDCDELLAVFDKIKTRSASGPKLWKSFRLAIMEVMKTGEIEQLQGRIDSYQRAMVVHLCSVSR